MSLKDRTYGLGVPFLFVGFILFLGATVGYILFAGICRPSDTSCIALSNEIFWPVMLLALFGLALSMFSFVLIYNGRKDAQY
jgi:hypothetical protein